MEEVKEDWISFREIILEDSRDVCVAKGGLLIWKEKVKMMVKERSRKLR